ncbi:hypothetical protein JB92DRAFT_698278 [Gautieria morchelliformis]|nr:hypothetical protein JB92DRAFT_698278 [Gautieria morchelliformis]
MRNLFGSTECGVTMWSVGGRGRDARYLCPLQDVSCAFLPIHKGNPCVTNAVSNRNDDTAEAEPARI